MYDAIVLAGGAGRRLGGVDKGSVEVAGRSLLDRVLAAVGAAERRIVVGPPRELPAEVLHTSERPSGGGPVAAVAAGIELVEAPAVVVLACDLPFVTRATVHSLLHRLAGDRDARADGAQLVDETGRAQPLAAVYRTERLRAALAGVGTVTNSPMRRVVAALTMLDVETTPAAAWDCDTWADVARARDHAAKAHE